MPTIYVNELVKCELGNICESQNLKNDSECFVYLLEIRKDLDCNVVCPHCSHDQWDGDSTDIPEMADLLSR